MARIAGIDIPQDKRILISLTYVHGIGRSKASEILKRAMVDVNTRAKDLTEEEVASIRDVIEGGKYRIEGELRRVVTQNVKRLKEIRSYRGTRHERNLPARGQRTRTNARTKRGRRVTIGGLKVKITKT